MPGRCRQDIRSEPSPPRKASLSRAAGSLTPFPRRVRVGERGSERAAVVLIALALIKRFPYRYFFTTHRWLAVVYLALVVHSVVLTSFS